MLTKTTIKSTATQPGIKKRVSGKGLKEKQIYQLISYFSRECNLENRFPKEIKLMIVDYSLFGYFHPDAHQNITISNEGLTATNKSKTGYSTILFGFPFERSPKSVRMQHENDKNFKQIYVVKLNIDQCPSSQGYYGLNNCSDSIGLAFVPLNYNLFNGAPDMLDGTYVIYGNGTRFGWIGNRIGEDCKLTWTKRGTKLTIKVDLKNKSASISKENNANYSALTSMDVNLPKNMDDDDTEHDIIRLAFILNSPCLRQDDFTTQITVTDQYWE